MFIKKMGSIKEVSILWTNHQYISTLRKLHHIISPNKGPLVSCCPFWLRT